VLLFLDGIMLARYTHIFWLKNPAGILDDFWIRFANVWIVGFNTASQFVFVWLPGMEVQGSMFFGGAVFVHFIFIYIQQRLIFIKFYACAFIHF
jgi:hypothetical protein